MRTRHIALGVLLLSAGCLATAQVLSLQSACNPVINFFPTAADIKPTVPITTTVYDNSGNATVVTCGGTDNCAAPEPVFVSSSQVDYMPDLQTNINNGLLKVVLAPGSAVPRLFFTVSSLLLTAKSDVTACIPVATTNTTLPAVRRLLSSTVDSDDYISTDSLSTAVRQLASVAVITVVDQPKPTTNVSQAGTWSFIVSMDGGLAVQGTKNGNAGVVELPNDDSAVGEHCVEINVTINGYSLTPSSGPYATPTVSRNICWYKPAVAHVDAQLKFDMCSTKKFTVNISSIAPLANDLTQNGRQVLSADGTPAVFFKPVLQLFGRKSRNLDGSEVAAYSYDASTEDGVNFINRYIIPSTNITSASVLSYILDENVLEEGYYNMSAKISMISDYGNLIADSIGKGVITQSDVYGAAVLGKTEIMATQLLAFEEIGVQYTPTVLSQVSSDKLNKAIKAGDTITFSWNFAGVQATQNCYHGTTLIANCTSPLKVQALDVSTANSTVTFTVEFTDICGNTKKADFTYSQNGVTSSDMVAITATKPKTTTPKSSAGAIGTASSFLPTAFMAVAGTPLLMWMLN